MKKTFEKIALILKIFGFGPIEKQEENRAYVWRMKNVSSSKIARNYVLAIARTFGPGYSFGVRYNGPKGMYEREGKYSGFIKNPGKPWESRWVLDVSYEDSYVGTFVFFIK